jgi:hypothetical protein
MGLLVSLLVIVLLAPALLAGCGDTEIVKGENNMLAETKIPLIDTRVPEVTETATFALG